MLIKVIDHIMSYLMPEAGVMDSARLIYMACISILLFLLYTASWSSPALQNGQFKVFTHHESRQSAWKTWSHRVFLTISSFVNSLRQIEHISSPRLLPPIVYVGMHSLK